MVLHEPHLYLYLGRSPSHTHPNPTTFDGAGPVVVLGLIHPAAVFLNYTDHIDTSDDDSLFV
jgi:hypothetical protein